MPPAPSLPRTVNVADVLERLPRYLRGLGFVRLDPTGRAPQWQLDAAIAERRVETWRAREYAALDTRVRLGHPEPPRTADGAARLRLAWATCGFLVRYFTFELPPTDAAALRGSHAERNASVRDALARLAVFTNLPHASLVEAILRAPT